MASAGAAASCAPAAEQKEEGSSCVAWTMRQTLSRVRSMAPASTATPPTAGVAASCAPTAEQEEEESSCVVMSARIMMLRRSSATSLHLQSASSNRIVLLLV
jgi:hypothetical protein